MSNQEKKGVDENVQPQQPNFGQPSQQPYNQQPNGYQPPYGYQQPPQPPYYGQPPQYYASQPQQFVMSPVVASPAEKEAAFSSGSSVFMLILCIVGTINLITGFIGKILTLDIGGILLYVLNILIVVGTWLTYAYARKNKLSSKGISLIRIPYIIFFVFSVLGFVGNLVIWILTLNIISLIIGIVSFIFQCICFSSVNKTLKLARDINQNKSVTGRKAGSFAAIVLIITAAIQLISEIVGYFTLETIKEALEKAGAPEFLTALIGGGGVMVIVVAVIAFIVNIAGAIVMLKFGKKVKLANVR